jgi:sugar lactone lactonase YvrE
LRSSIIIFGDEKESSKGKIFMDIKLAYQANDRLGEGPVWVPEEQALYWVDILQPALQRWQPESGSYKKWLMPNDIGCFSLREHGGAVVALRTGFAYLDLDTGKVKPLNDPESDKPYTRFNDGKCDRFGRFWAGTMDEGAPNNRGAFYRLDPNGEHRQMLDQIGTSNGLGWSPDNRIMYYTDSAKRTIWSYDFDPEKGTMTNQKVFAKTPEAFVPDGLTVDADGFIWSAKWNGWKVVRYAPDGSIDLEVPLPVQRPTSCMFGGEKLNQLYITSASVGLTEPELQDQLFAGCIFEVATDTQGLPEPRYAG